MKIIVGIIILIVIIYFVFTEIYPKQNEEIIGYNNVDNSIPETISSYTSNNQAWINIIFDNYNKIITITGVVGNQRELRNIITNIASTYENFKIQDEISIDAILSSTDYAINILLISAIIKPVQNADIYYSNVKLVIKGLIRNKIERLELIAQLKEIFTGKIKIIDELTIVLKHQEDIPKLEFNLPELPKLNP